MAEREVLRWRVKIVIPQISKFEIFNQIVSDEELLLISYFFFKLRGNQEQKRNALPDLLDTYQ